MTRALRLLLAATALCGPALAFAMLPIQHWTQPGGARIYLVESRVLPMVDIQLDFDAGTRRDPAGKPALANFTANLLEKGLAARDPRRGAEQPPSPFDAAMDENRLGEAWADLGASFDAEAGGDRMSFFIRSLTDPDLLARAVALAARQIGEPSFPAAVWERDRARTVASLRESLTRPATVAGRAFMPAVFGSHPYGGETTEESLATVSVDDMRAFHARHVQACQARITIVGAVSREQADRLAGALLARLPAPSEAGACQALPAVPEVAPLAAPVRRDIPFDSAQAHVFMGQPGYKRSDPDAFPMLVGNYILGGGGFVSRLSTEVREKRGLSYSVYSSFSPGLHAGAFFVGLQTRPDQAQQAVQVARDVVARFVADGPTAAELQAAKDNLVGGFALRIDSNRKLLDNVSAMAWYDLPLDYLQTWTRRVEAVTVADVRAAFQRKLQPDRMVTVIVGGAPVVQSSTR
ncbi:M16 family metallopeptidase [Ramlibacter sp. MAHUQ-53]|uniref:M16 family metallopeptidase n=1 Tax=unclassified Ramlibacter TaxID=2617605 RepID=UPI003635B9F1